MGYGLHYSFRQTLVAPASAETRSPSRVGAAEDCRASRWKETIATENGALGSTCALETGRLESDAANGRVYKSGPAPRAPSSNARSTWATMSAMIALTAKSFGV